MSTLLEVKDLSIAFGGVKALQKLSFSVNEGEIMGFIGPNGSGKSTCVNVISGLYKRDEGEVFFDNKAITPKHSITERVHMGLGRTFQTPRPFSSLSVYDNVFAVALQHHNKAAAADKARELLEFTGLWQYRDMVSSKLPIELRKWLDLTRALVNDPKMLMMDEVMAGLNPSEMSASCELVKKINERGITILFIEHVMQAVVGICSRVVVINEGHFLCEGEPKEVLKRKEVIESYIGGGGQDAEN